MIQTADRRSVGVLATAAQGPTSPAFRIRVMLPSHELESHGVSIRARPLFTEREAAGFQTGSAIRRATTLTGARRRLAATLAAATSADAATALIQRQVDMLPFRRLERLAIGDRRLVLDVDDAIWLDTTPDAAGHRLAFLKDSARKVSWLAGEAAVVIAGNELLADWLSARSAVVTVVPSLVDPRTTPVRRHAERERVVWGWIGSPSSAAHLQARAEWIGEAARSLDRSPRLLVVGAKAPQIAGVEIDERPWTEDNERHALESMDIGLMPLHDSAWTRGKCAYKALQYMNAGIPVVSDDVGVSAATVGHEQGGLVTSDRTGWIEALRELSLDATLRARLGATARERVESGFSITGWAPKLASLLRGDLP